ncbi:GDP-mannose-dependent alpha-(1-6)-phosphatidylinositol monomannoside mannosyltransferase [Actinomycetes bacterium]|nr:GDP-mannose-dependent alpha-(1-6)-phosphatidylinositol monomannoside mannosyltransferase [Actinomycetes bacterium]
MENVYKKILLVTNDFGPRAGGIETFVIGLLERIKGHEVTVFTSQQGDTSVYDQQWLDKFGVRVVRDKSKILLPSWRVTRAAKKIVAVKNIDVVVFGAAAPLALMSPSLRKSGVKKIIALTHGHEVWWAKIFPFKLAIKRIGKNVDHLTYLGEFTRQAISEALSRKSATEMVKIAPGIDTAHFIPQPDAMQKRKELGLQDKKIIISVGRLVHRKGQDSLIQAMPAVLKKIPNAHLLLVGEGPYKKHLEKLVMRLSLKQNVTFAGRIMYDRLPSYLSAADLFAMPSRSRFFGLEVEGLGIVYLEASACGIPVVAGNSGGAPDAVLEGVTGLCVDGTNIEQITRAIVEICRDAERASHMGAAGRNWIVDQWRWDIWSKEFNALLVEQ